MFDEETRGGKSHDTELLNVFSKFFSAIQKYIFDLKCCRKNMDQNGSILSVFVRGSSPPLCISEF